MSKELIDKIKSEFKRKFSSNPLLVSSPGRINLIGEHTDYNMGLVLPATINKYIIVALAESKKKNSEIYSLDFDETLKIDFNKLNKQEVGSWKNYLIGVVSGILNSGLQIENFNLIFGGNIPIGAGLSSSAALENGIVLGLNKLFNLGLSKNEIMNISIAAEHDFAGVDCGVMDQFANLNGKTGNAILLDCYDLSFQHIPLRLNEHQLLLINTNVKHQLSNSAYNKRKLECNTGLKILQNKYPQLKSLSNANIQQLNSVKEKLSLEVFKRCRFVIEENERVKSAKTALENHDWQSFGNLLFASHDGLSNLYEVSCVELDFLVEKAKENDSILGSRMIGGGFGGCTLNLIKKDATEKFVSMVDLEYQEKFGVSINPYSVTITNGTQIIPTEKEPFS